MAASKQLTLRTVFIVILLSLISTRTWAGNDIQFLQEKAIYWQNHGKDNLATNAWKQLLLIDPNNPNALAGLAMIANQSGNKEKAIEYLDRLEAIAPHSPDIARIKAAINFNPQRERLLRQAASLQASKSYAEAVNVYDQALRGMPVPPNLAAGYFNALSNIPGGRSRAITALQDLVKTHPQDPQYALVLGQILTYAADSRTKGIEMLARLAEHQALIWEGASPAAVPLLRAYLERYPDAILAAQLKKAEAAAAAVRQGAIQRAIDAQQASLLAQERAGYAALHSGRLNTAEQIFKKLLHAHPKNWHYLDALADVYMAAQSFSDAVTTYQRAEAMAPARQRSSIVKKIRLAQSYAMLRLAGNAASSGQYDTAIRLYRSFLDKAPDNIAALKGLAGAYTAEKRYAEAIATYRRAITSEPNDASLWINLIGVLDSAGQDSAALEVARSIPAAARMAVEEKAGYWASIGDAYAGLKDYVQARSAFQKAMRIGGGASPALQLQLAWVLYNSGAYDELKQILGQLDGQTLDTSQQEQIEKLMILSAEQQANVAVRSKDYNRARAILQTLNAKYPGNPEIRRAVTNIQLLEAWQLYRDKDDRQLYALIVRLRGKKDLTASQQQQIDEIFRYAADREAGELISEKNYHAAAAIYHNMSELFPKSPHYVRQLANVYLAAGRTSDAYRLFLRVGPGDTPSSYAEAVNAAFAAHDLDQAWKWTRKGLSLWPDDLVLLKLSAQIAEARGDPASALAYYEDLLHRIPGGARGSSAIVPAVTVAEPMPPFAGE